MLALRDRAISRGGVKIYKIVRAYGFAPYTSGLSRGMMWLAEATRCQRTDSLSVRLGKLRRRWNAGRDDGKVGAIYRQYLRKALSDACRPIGWDRSWDMEAYPLL